MKNLLILLSFLLLFSCGSSIKKYQFKIKYAFEDSSNISEAQSKMTAEVLKKRLSKLTKHFDVTTNSNNEIVIQMTKGYSQDRLNAVVLNEGKLDFWLSLKKEDVLPLIAEARTLKMEKFQDSNSFNPLGFIKDTPSFDGVFQMKVSDTTQMRTFLTKAKAQEQLTDQLKNIDFLFSLPKNNVVTLYAVKTNTSGRALINESHIEDAQDIKDAVDRPAINISMTKEAADIWEEMTGKAFKEQLQIAITVNNIVFSAPAVSFGPISGGKTQISGNFTQEEALELAIVLGAQQRIPKLKLIKVDEIENQ